jgi:hypothetical protein
MTDLIEMATLYHTQNHKLLRSYLGREMKNGSAN